MTEEFFGLTNTPFSREIPADKLYESAMMMETIDRLTYAANKQLFAVLTSDVGCGKTTAVRRLCSVLDSSKYTFLYVSDSQVTPRWFYKCLLEQMGVVASFYRGEAKNQLHRELEVIRGVHKRKIVTIVDEAHLLAKETLEEIRFLLNYQMDSVSPMALILVGQNELWDKLKLICYAAIRQRIDLKCELPQFDRSQTAEYIDAHMRWAGCDREVFTDKAVDEIYKYSAGAARAVNKLCTHCMLYAAQRSKKIIDDHAVKFVIEGELP
jgi:type II secretory pathway predicted ATPase ExeA